MLVAILSGMLVSSLRVECWASYLLRLLETMDWILLLGKAMLTRRSESLVHRHTAVDARKEVVGIYHVSTPRVAWFGIYCLANYTSEYPRLETLWPTTAGPIFSPRRSSNVLLAKSSKGNRSRSLRLIIAFLYLHFDLKALKKGLVLLLFPDLKIET